MPAIINGLQDAKTDDFGLAYVYGLATHTEAMRYIDTAIDGKRPFSIATDKEVYWSTYTITPKKREHLFYSAAKRILEIKVGAKVDRVPIKPGESLHMKSGDGESIQICYKREKSYENISYSMIPVEIRDEFIPVLADGTIFVEPFSMSTDVNWKRTCDVPKFRTTLTILLDYKQGFSFICEKTKQIYAYDASYVKHNLIPHMLNGKVSGLFEYHLTQNKTKLRCVPQLVTSKTIEYEICSDSD